MNIRKNIDYSELYAALDVAMEKGKSQMGLYFDIGKAVCIRRDDPRDEARDLLGQIVECGQVEGTVRDEGDGNASAGAGAGDLSCSGGIGTGQQDDGVTDVCGIARRIGEGKNADDRGCLLRDEGITHDGDKVARGVTVDCDGDAHAL